MAAPKIVFCFDVVSPYSFFAFQVLTRYMKHPAWSHVKVDFLPLFLGGIMGATGNQPPATLPARGKQLGLDVQRHAKIIGIKVRQPSKFPVLSLKAMRMLTVIKDKHPDKLVDASFALWKAFWQEDKDISNDDVIATYLAPVIGESTARGYLAKECNEAKCKDALSAATKLAVDNGAYGAPWWIITNSQGKTEPFFGSDRWPHICDFLGLPWFGSDPLSAPADALPGRL
ncbi:thioredoxin-like protein [Hyaloraphidium curvatum]|nr:thioredoxin-like protein [Hyaloraphidium curvatum]